MGWAVFSMGFSWALVSAGLIWGAANVLPQAIIPAIGVAVLGFVFLGLLSATLKGIYTAALYQYATTGKVEHFQPEMMGGAFRPK